MKGIIWQISFTIFIMPTPTWSAAKEPTSTQAITPGTITKFNKKTNDSDLMTMFLSLIISREKFSTKKRPSSSGPLVNTTKGPVEGLNAHGVNVFLGIPFAAPPIGNLRFQPPKNVSKWDERLLATKFQNVCMQKRGLDTPPNLNISEDCLYLNVITPKLNQSLPVLVFIHGGTFIDGSAAMYPVRGIAENLAQRDVVVVTINYRLNVFGFFTTNTSSFPANLGILDQIKALKWVQDEISQFGGNPGDVTIFGSSAGAASVSLLTYSPIARGLFHRAIMNSGTIYCPWALDGIEGYSKHSSRYLAIDSGCITKAEWMSKNFKNLTSCLRNLPAETLQKLAQTKDWMPSVDGRYGILPDWPENLIHTRDRNMPIILGTNKDEQAVMWIISLFLGQVRPESFGRATFEQTLNSTIVKEKLGRQTKKARDLIRFIYLQSRQEPISRTDFLEWFHVTVQMASGYTMFAPTFRESKAFRASNNTNVYLYSFDYVSDGFPYPGGIDVTFHGMDLFFIFNNMWQTVSPIPWKFTRNDQNISNQFGEMWTTFAKTGKPSEVWKPLTYVDQQEPHPVAFSIKLCPKMQDHYERLATHLWNSLVPGLLSNPNNQSF